MTPRSAASQPASQATHVNIRLLSILQAFNTVGWLDLTAAKVKFRLWLGGIMPSCKPLPLDV